MYQTQTIALFCFWIFSVGPIIILAQPIHWTQLPIPRKTELADLHRLEKFAAQWAQTDLDSAFFYLDQLRIKVKADQFPAAKCEILRRLGEIREAQQMMTAAIDFYQRASDCAKKQHSSLSLCDLNRKLASLHLNNGEKVLAMRYLQITMADPLCRKLISDSDRDSLYILLGSFYSEQSPEAREESPAPSPQEPSTPASTPFLWVSGLISLFVSFLLAWIWTREKKKQSILQTRLQETTEKLDLSKDEQQSLELELEQKRKQLTAMSLNLAQRNQMITEFKAQLGSLEASSTPEANALIHRMKRQVEQHLSIDQNWEEFNRQFQQIHKGFLSRLKQEYPKLTTGDLRLCALLKLNLSTNEIAALQGIAPQSVRITTYRIRKKMGLPKGTKLSEFLLSLT